MAVHQHLKAYVLSKSELNTFNPCLSLQCKRVLVSFLSFRVAIVKERVKNLQVNNQ